MSVQRARTPEEYADWVKQALFEVEDLRHVLEYELDERETFPSFLDPLEQGIRAIYDAMREGRYHFGREDLPFMVLLRKYSDEIPFDILLQQINETHRHGLDVPEDLT